MLSELTELLSREDLTFFLDAIHQEIDENQTKSRKLIKLFRRAKFKQLNRFVRTYPSFFLQEGKKVHHESFFRFVESQLRSILVQLSFTEISTSEFENISRHFDLLNIQEDHPSRSESDTFYITKDIVARTQTTVSATYIMNYVKNFFTLGKVFRKDDDPRHLPCFHQMEIWFHITCISELFDVLRKILQEIWNCAQAKMLNFKPMPEIRFRHHTFPYTKCSFEVDIHCSCISGCKFCSLGWIELLGGGIFNKSVLDLNRTKSKFLGAFGLGIERLSIVLFNYLNRTQDNISNIYDLY